MEEWRDVPGYEGLYQISISTKEGRCRRIHNDGHYTTLSTTPNKRDGRINWRLSMNDKQVTRQAARWIAITFPELVQNAWFPGAEIDHIDTDRMNNHPSNLRWCTRKGNMQNGLTRERISKINTGSGNSFYGKHHTSETIDKIIASNIKKKAKFMMPVVQLSLSGDVIREYKSACKASAYTNIERANISSCCRGERKTAGGFIWKYAE